MSMRVIAMEEFEKEAKGPAPSITDYAHALETLIREEGDRIHRILARIDESMAAINKSRSIVK